MTLSDSMIDFGLRQARLLRGRLVTVRNVPADQTPSSLQVTAIPLETVDDADPTHNAIELRQKRDWALLVSDLDFGNGPEMPDRYWELDTTETGHVITYRMIAPAPNDDVHERMTADGTWLRIHTKRISTV